MRGEWVGPQLEDGPAPARVAITAHEIRFKGSLTLELLSVHRGRDAGCPAPPAQIRTCALTHTAPTSGV